MSRSQALEEEYASGRADGVDLVALVLDHPTFPAPVYLVAGSDDDLMLPVATGGATQLHTAVAFDFTPPGFDKDGPTDGRVSIDNVSQYLNEYLELATASTDAIAVTIRIYSVDRQAYVTPTVVDDEYSGLIIRSVTLTESTAEGALTWPDVREQNFPLGIYTAEEYPALVGL